MADILGSFLGGLGGGTIGSAGVRLYLDSAAYNAELDQAEARTATASKSMGSSFGGLAKAFSGASLAAIGVGAAAAIGIAKGVSATEQWAASVRSLQRVTGQSAEDASKLAGAGELLGLDVTKLTTGFGLLSKNIVNGSANLTKYGVATTDAAGNTLPFTEILGNISDKFATLQQGPQQAAFAMNIFGRSGKDLIPILQRGSSGLQDLYDKVQAAGLVMDQQGVDAAKNLSIAQRDLGEAVKGASIAFGQAFIPVLTSVTEILTSAVELFAAIPEPIRNIGITAAVAAAALVLFNKAFIGLLLGKAIPALLLNIATGLEAVGASSAANGLAGAAAAMEGLSLASGTLALALAPVALILVGIKVHADSMRAALQESQKAISTAVEQLATDTSDSAALINQSFDGINGGLVAFTIAYQFAVDQAVKGGGDIQQVAKDTQTALTQSFSEGKISAQSFVDAMEFTGLSAAQADRALRQTAASSDTLRVHFDAAGNAVRNFAGLTGSALQKFRADFNSTIQSTFGDFDTFDNHWTQTGNHAQSTLEQMKKGLQRFDNDLSVLNKLPVGDNVKQFLLTSPGLLDNFVHAGKNAQSAMVSSIKGIGDETDTAKSKFDKLTNGVDNVKTSMDKLNGAQANISINASVRVTAQDPALQAAVAAAIRQQLAAATP